MRFAWRRFWRFRASSLTPVALLALGISASTAIYGVANAHVFRPMFPAFRGFASSVKTGQFTTG